MMLMTSRVVRSSLALFLCISLGVKCETVPLAGKASSSSPLPFDLPPALKSKYEQMFNLEANLGTSINFPAGNASLDGSGLGMFSEQMAESFLAKFLDTKRIEDFVKVIPAGQELLKVMSIVPVSTIRSKNPWRVKSGVQEELLVSLRNTSKTNSSIVLFGILSNITDVKKGNEIIRKNKAVTYSLEIMPGHEATVIYPFTLSGSFEEKAVLLDLTVHYMDKASKLFGKCTFEPKRLELQAGGAPAWLDFQLLIILAVTTGFLSFLSWLIFQAFLKPRKHKRRHSE